MLVCFFPCLALPRSDWDLVFSPLAHGVGMEVGRSDPVFMAKMGSEPMLKNRPEFPQEYKKKDELLLAGDPAQMEEMRLGMGWINEVCSGRYRSWEELQFLRDNWDGPIVLKGIQTAKVKSFVSLFYLWLTGLG